MTKGYIMSSTEFKETVETMVRDMPLADMLYINQSLIEAAITKWKEKDPETEMSPAQRGLQSILRIPRKCTGWYYCDRS